GAAAAVETAPAAAGGSTGRLLHCLRHEEGGRRPAKWRCALWHLATWRLRLVPLTKCVRMVLLPLLICCLLPLFAFFVFLLLFCVLRDVGILLFGEGPLEEGGNDDGLVLLVGVVAVVVGYPSL
ncbi:unnamed protein product, partial [Heterosigma akashiwo]